MGLVWVLSFVVVWFGFGRCGLCGFGGVWFGVLVGAVQACLVLCCGLVCFSAWFGGLRCLVLGVGSGFSGVWVLYYSLVLVWEVWARCLGLWTGGLFAGLVIWLGLRV